jgi:phenylalanyl-tRNA synthetase beta chain
VDAARESAVGLGFVECRSVSFVPRRLTAENPVALLHPLSADEGFLRTDLVPVLIRALEHNYANGRRDVRLFEIGTVFRRSRAGLGGHEIGTVRGVDVNTDGVPDVDSPFAEELRAAGLFTGRRQPPHWSGEAGIFDIWDLKGILEGLSEPLGLGRVDVGDPPEEDSDLAFGADLWLGEERFGLFDGRNLVGIGGRVDPAFVDAPPWGAPVYALEFRLAAVDLERVPEFHPLPEYPVVTRDIALDSPLNVAAGDVKDLLWEAAPEILESVEVFDVYEGEAVAEGRRSLAWRLVFRAPDRTLRDREVDRSLEKLISALEARFDVRVRSS